MGVTRKLLKIYAVVSNDSLELPLCVGTANECCNYLKIPMWKFKNTVHASSHLSDYKIVYCNLKENISNG